MYRVAQGIECCKLLCKEELSTPSDVRKSKLLLVLLPLWKAGSHKVTAFAEQPRAGAALSKQWCKAMAAAAWCAGVDSTISQETICARLPHSHLTPSCAPWQQRLQAGNRQMLQIRIFFFYRELVIKYLSGQSWDTLMGNTHALPRCQVAEAQLGSLHCFSSFAWYCIISPHGYWSLRNRGNSISGLLPENPACNMRLHGINITINIAVRAALAVFKKTVLILNDIIYSKALSQAFEHLNDRILILDTLRKPNGKQRTTNLRIQNRVLFLKDSSTWK